MRRIFSTILATALMCSMMVTEASANSQFRQSNFAVTNTLSDASQDGNHYWVEVGDSYMNQGSVVVKVSFYKSNIADTQKQLLKAIVVEDGAGTNHIVVLDGWLYFDIGGDIYKMKTDGTSYSQVSSFHVRPNTYATSRIVNSIRVVDDWVYYDYEEHWFEGGGQGDSLMDGIEEKRVHHYVKAKTDGSQSLQVAEGFENALIDNGYIYYNYACSMVRTDLNGTNKITFEGIRLGENWAFAGAVFANNAFYFRTQDGEEEVYSIFEVKPGQNPRKIITCNDYIQSFAVNEEYIFYPYITDHYSNPNNPFDWANYYGIARCDLNGEGQTILQENIRNSDMWSSGEWVYYFRGKDQLYRCDWNGYNEQQITSNPTYVTSVADGFVRYRCDKGNRNFEDGVIADRTGKYFTDVTSGAYYADAVKWAVEKNITAGTTATTFAPDATCTNGQILTFLWRANGQPEPTVYSELEIDEEGLGTVRVNGQLGYVGPDSPLLNAEIMAGIDTSGSFYLNPFKDVKASDYFYKAAVWSSEKGLIAGTTLGADTPCTRSMVVTYLWKMAGQPEATKATSFTDVDSNADYAKAVAWAVEQGITSGTSATTFAPDGICTRGQIVTFLFRAIGK